MGRALIIGGSLGGLFAGLLLRQAGWEVTVFEKSTDDLASRGDGIGTHVEMFEIMRRLGIVVDQSIGRSFSSRSCLAHDGSVIAELPFVKILTSWMLLYRALRRQLPDACYRAGMQLDDITQWESGVTAIFADGTRMEGDLLIGADGLHSTVRARAFPAAPAPVYAGYVGWRGVIEENAVPQQARGELFESYAFYLPPREMFLSYLQPGADDDLTPGRRRMNWLWYHPTNAAALRDMFTDAAGRHHAAIPPPLIRPEVIAAFRAVLRSRVAAHRRRARAAVGRRRLRCAAACRRRRHQGGVERGVAHRCAQSAARYRCRACHLRRAGARLRRGAGRARAIFGRLSGRPAARGA